MVKPHIDTGMDIDIYPIGDCSLSCLGNLSQI